MNTSEIPLVDDYLRRLRAALAGLPADRRREIIEDVTQHIAEARRQLEQDRQDSAEAIHAILGQLGDPDVIAADALDAERGSAAAAGPPPPSVRHAVWLMLAGAAVSLAAAIADITTKSELREVIARTPMARLSALSPWPVTVRVLTVIGWLAGLGATVFLWQKASTAYFKARSRR